MFVKLTRPFFVNDQLYPAGVHEFADSFDRKLLPPNAVVVDGPEPEAKPEPIKPVSLSELGKALQPENDPLTGRPRAETAASKVAHSGPVSASGRPPPFKL